MHSQAPIPTSRGGTRRSFLPMLCLLVIAFGGWAVAQEIGSDISDGGNVAITVKRVLVPYRFQVERDSRAQWFFQRVKKNNADDSVLATDATLVETSRQISAITAETATLGSVTITFEQHLAFQAKFGKKFYDQDHP